jgi:hypothetical protein
MKKIRYKEASDDAYRVLDLVRQEHFPELAGAKIKVLFDLKKHLSGGKIVLGRIMRADDLVKLLTVPDFPGGADYVIILDGECWGAIGLEDKTKLMRHELRHTIFNPDKDNPYGLLTHDIEDFIAEVSLNSDDPGWRRRVASLALGIYEAQEDVT